MKRYFLLFYRYCLVARGWLPVVAFLVGCPVSAQNLLSNPGFESPLGTNDWTIVFVTAGPPDLHLADETTFKPHSGTFALHLRPSTDGVVHAYYKQTVSGLLPGTNYVVSGWLAWDGEADQAAGRYNVYIETIGGLGSLKTPSATAAATGDYAQYSLTQTADAHGQIEVRLHLDRYQGSACCGHIFQLNGFFDDISLTVK